MKIAEAYRAMTDNELVVAMKGGDKHAFEAIFLRWYPQVLRFIQTIVKENTLAEDLSQIVFMKIWIFRERLNPSKSFKNYLFVLAKNGAIDTLKLKKYILMEDVSPVIEPHASDMTESHLEFDETNSKILKIINEMPSQRRFVFNLSRFQDKSNREISEMLGVSVRTVEKHIELALRDLRRYLS
jgi:RNA polymerase sigma-70 factor (ECF subfamily)